MYVYYIYTYIYIYILYVCVFNTCVQHSDGLIELQGVDL